QHGAPRVAALERRGEGHRGRAGACVMMETVRRDLDRYLRHSAGDRRARVLAIATNCGLQAVLVYRFGRWLQRLQRAQWWLFPLLIPGWILYWLPLLLARHRHSLRLSA